MITKEDYTVEFMHYGSIIVPKGTRTTHETATGIDKKYNFVDQFDWVKRDYPSFASILIHDLQIRGLNIPKEYLEDV